MSTCKPAPSAAIVRLTASGTCSLWMGVGGGVRVRDGGDVDTHTADTPRETEGKSTMRCVPFTNSPRNSYEIDGRHIIRARHHQKRGETDAAPGPGTACGKIYNSKIRSGSHSECQWRAFNFSRPLAAPPASSLRASLLDPRPRGRRPRLPPPPQVSSSPRQSRNSLPRHPRRALFSRFG